jgi:hypothetical protein
MRVATVFTGVAACAVGMTQVADAQVTHQAGAQRVRPEGRVDGSIRYTGNCGTTGAEANWLHISTYLYYLPTGGATYVGSVCFGYKGIYQSPPGIGMNAACGGNNHGYLNGEKAGRSVSFHYGPGRTTTTPPGVICGTS